MATRTYGINSAANIQGGSQKSLLYTMAELINDLVAVGNELRTDHGTTKTTLDQLETLAEELGADHATFRTAALEAQQAMYNGAVSPGSLRIDGGSASAAAETQNALYYIAAGTIVLVAAGTNLPALAGTVSNGDFGIYLYTGDPAGTITQATLVTGASLAALVIPDIPTDEAVLGAIIVNPTGTGDFVGGTTALDDATVVPNAAFINGSAFGTGFDPGASAPPATLSAATAITSGPAAISAAAVDDISFRELGAP